MRKRLPCSFSGNSQRFQIAKKISKEMKINLNDYLNDAIDSLINNYGKEYRIAMLVREREAINLELEKMDKFKMPTERLREITDGYELVKDTASKYLKSISMREVKGVNIWHSINGAAKAHMVSFDQAKTIYLEVLPNVVQDPDKVQYLYNEINVLNGGVKVA